jgi:antitoxin HicB
VIPDVPYRFMVRPLTQDEGGGYLVEFPDLPGCMSDGETVEEAILNGVDAMTGWLAAMRAEGHPVPPPARSAAA